MHGRARSHWYYASPVDESGVGLFEAATNGGSRRHLATLDDRPGTFGGLKATDGEYLYFTWHQSFSDIWMMDIVEGGQ